MVMRMFVEAFTVGYLSTNCYVVNSQLTKEAVIIDPGLDDRSESLQILEYVDLERIKVKFIVNTHGHPDHVHGNALLQEKYNVPVCVHRLDAAYVKVKEKSTLPASVLLEDGFLVKFGDDSLRVMHTPGHTPGSICLLGEKLVFTGDTLFAGSIGRTDFPGGSYQQIQSSLQKLARLPDYFLVYPGHGPTSMIGEEKSSNPFLNLLEK